MCLLAVCCAGCAVSLLTLTSSYSPIVCTAGYKVWLLTPLLLTSEGMMKDWSERELLLAPHSKAGSRELAGPGIEIRRTSQDQER